MLLPRVDPFDAEGGQAAQNFLFGLGPMARRWWIRLMPNDKLCPRNCCKSGGADVLLLRVSLSHVGEHHHV
jgi:hypothetical protein